ncbi:MAG: hypothetical protein R3B70_22365 [Polyangiaceae bacterium]
MSEKEDERTSEAGSASPEDSAGGGDGAGTGESASTGESAGTGESARDGDGAGDGEEEGAGPRVDEDGLPLDREPTIDDVRSQEGKHGRIAMGCAVSIVLLVLLFWLIRGGVIG